MGRKIKTFSTSLGLVNYDVEADTWGELEKELKRNGAMTDDMKGLIKELGTTFTSGEAELPRALGKDNNGNITHDFTLFLQPVKTKSGIKLHL